MVVTIAKEVKDGKGVIGINLNLDNILKISKMINIGEKGYAVILDQNKQIVSHPSRNQVQKLLILGLNRFMKKNKEMSLIQNKMIKAFNLCNK